MVSVRSSLALHWHKWVGILLVALAVHLAIDPDYPVPRKRGELPASRPRTAPSAETPVGECAADEVEFRWRWDGPSVAWRVVVLDDDLEPIATANATSPSSLSADPALRAQLRDGEQMHWYVEGTFEGCVVRSAVVPFQIVR